MLTIIIKTGSIYYILNLCIAMNIYIWLLRDLKHQVYQTSTRLVHVSYQKRTTSHFHQLVVTNKWHVYTSAKPLFFLMPDVPVIKSKHPYILTLPSQLPQKLRRGEEPFLTGMQRWDRPQQLIAWSAVFCPSVLSAVWQRVYLRATAGMWAD